MRNELMRCVAPGVEKQTRRGGGHAVTPSVTRCRMRDAMPLLPERRGSFLITHDLGGMLRTVLRRGAVQLFGAKLLQCT